MSSDLTFITNEQGKHLADRFGQEAAASIAEKIGAKKFTRNSNEFEWNGHE